MKKHILRIAKTLAILLFWLVIWEIISLIAGRELIVPSPLSVWKCLLGLAVTGEFWIHIALSILRIVIGYLCALLIGAAVGILTSLSSVLDAVLAPVSRIIRATPVASFIILLFVFMARNNIPVFTAFLMVFPVVWANVYEGIRSCDRKLLQMAFVFRFRRSAVLKKIYIPSVMPFFMAAARTGMGLAWKAGIAAEVLISPRFGIGAALYNSKIYLETTELFAWTAVIIMISVILEKLFVLLMKKFYQEN